MEHLQETEHVLIIHVQESLTALHIASQMEVVQLLLQKHADVSISRSVTACLNNGTPLTPIHVPVTYRDGKVLHVGLHTGRAVASLGSQPYFSMRCMTLCCQA